MPSAQLRLSVAVEHTLGKVRKQRHASGLQQVQDELGDHQFGLGFAGLRVGGRSGFGSSFGAFGFGRLLPFFPDLRLLFEASSIPAPSTSRERLTPINASRIELSETSSSPNSGHVTAFPKTAAPSPSNCCRICYFKLSMQ
jgi:hypothetical protein